MEVAGDFRAFYEDAMDWIRAFHQRKTADDRFRIHEGEDKEDFFVCCDEAEVILSLLYCCKEHKATVREIRDEKIVFHSMLDEGVLLGKNRIYQAYEGGVRRLSFWQCRDMQDVEFRKDSSGEYRYTGDNREVDVRDNRHVQPPGLFQYVGYL